MERTHILRAITVLVLIIIGMFVFAYIKRAEIKETTPPTVEVTDTKESPYAYITRVDAKHFYINGTHTIVGEIPFPTPCDLLNWETRVAESYPEQVTVAFDVINNAEMCTQVVTPQRFKVSFDASESARIRATLEGRDIELNLIPASPSESPDDYELFIKG